MEFGNNLIRELRQRLDPGAGDGGERIEWHALHARLAAAHAARRALSAAAAGAGSGRFDGWGMVGNGPDRRPTPDVNPIDLTDGKSPESNGGWVAGQPGAGGRGQQ